MNTGLTIAFICHGKKHDTVINYKKFGNHFWDDAINNQSKIGYYFAYYFQQKYVYIHKIVNILQPNERPIEMEWFSNRQILCLSNQIKEFTWDEWTNHIGFGSPYTPHYRMTKTCSYSLCELQNHAKYKHFNFTQFMNIVEVPIRHINIEPHANGQDEEDDEYEIERLELLKKLEDISKRKLRRKKINILMNENEIDEREIKRLMEQILIRNATIKCITDGELDNEINEL